jgi:DNA-directed RNA polymerase II subunit RPB1
VTPGGIIHPQLYESDGSPKIGGLLDPRQGVIDKSMRCLTCQGQMNNCLGHFGHIELAEPIYHACFIPKIVKILRCVCFYCFKLLVPSHDPHMQIILNKFGYRDRRRFQQIYEYLKGITVCDGGRVETTIPDEGYIVSIYKK